MLCPGCTPVRVELSRIINSEDEEAAVDLFRKHGVLPLVVFCPRCKSECAYNSSLREWSCTVEKGKNKKKCPFSVRDDKGTWLESLTDYKLTKYLAFLDQYLTRMKSGDDIGQTLSMNYYKALFLEDWCNDVCKYWLSRQHLVIGGPDKEVEIGEIRIGTTRYKRGRLSRERWLFGAFERESKKLVVFQMAERSRECAVALITEYIHPQSFVYSYGSCTWGNLQREGFNYHLAKRPIEAMANPAPIPNPQVHVDNVINHLTKIMGYIIHTGNFECSYPQYIARYVFLQAHKGSQRLHRFLRLAARMYHHPNESE